MKQKKRLIIGALLLATGMLVAWKIKPVELIDDKLLIDLDTAIVEAGWGQEGNPGDGQDKPAPEEGEDIFISVQGENILLNGEKIKDTSALQSYLSKQMKEKSAVVLEDNYAEAHVYKEVYSLLETMQTEKHFKLSEIAR